MYSWWSDNCDLFRGRRTAPHPALLSMLGFCLGSFDSELSEKCCVGARAVSFLILPGDSLLCTTVPFPRVTVSRLKVFVCSLTVDSSRPPTILSALMNFDLSDQTPLRLCLPCCDFLVLVLFNSEFLWEESLKTRYALPLHTMLKFTVFSIYLREGSLDFKSKSSVCQHMYNKASGGSATT